MPQKYSMRPCPYIWDLVGRSKGRLQGAEQPMPGITGLPEHAVRPTGRPSAHIALLRYSRGLSSCFISGSVITKSPRVHTRGRQSVAVIARQRFEVLLPPVPSGSSQDLKCIDSSQGLTFCLCSSSSTLFSKAEIMVLATLLSTCANIWS